jgi:hypothetical protein
MAVCALTAPGVVRAEEMRRQKRERPDLLVNAGKEQPWVTEDTVRIAEQRRLERLEAARKARVRKRQEVKARLKRGGVPVEDEEGDDEDVFEGDDGMGRLDFEAVRACPAVPVSCRALCRARVVFNSERFTN